jgi:nitrate reductase gamma subunit
MSGAALWFGAVPMVLTIAAVIGTLYRLFTRPIRLEDRPARSKASPWSSLPVRWGLGIILAGHVLALLLPKMVIGWNSSPARLYLLEGTGLALAAWLLVGLLVSLIRYANDPGRSRPSAADVVVALGVIFLATTGILMAIAYRWGSYWGTEVAMPYLASLVSDDPRPDLMAGLPWVAQAHTVATFAVVAAFPFSRWMERLAAPAAAISRTVSDFVSPRQQAPAGQWLGWGASYLRAFLILAYFVVFTVVVPALVLGRLANVPDPVRDIVSAGVWTVFLAIGIGGLWWGQRKARV